MGEMTDADGKAYEKFLKEGPQEGLTQTEIIGIYKADKQTALNMKCKKVVSRKSVEGGNTYVLENANYAQKTYSISFSQEGIKKYSDLAGEPINTIDDLVSAINNGKINVSDLPIEYIVRDGNMLILNTRTSQALTRAGIPRSQWISVDRTGNQVFEQLLDGQLSRNKLTSEGISTVRPGGKK